MKTGKIKFIDIFLSILFFGMILFMLYPFWYVFMYSISDSSLATQGGLFLTPAGYSIDSYKTVFSNISILDGFKTSLLVTICGTLGGVLLTAMMAYPLSKGRLRGGTAIIFVVFLTMLFNGGMVPNYLLIKNLGFLDKYAALIFPGLISPFNLFIMKNFFSAMPEDIEESAKIDGANDIEIFLKLILPLSKAVLATIALFVAVGYWNDFFSTVLYITTKSKWSLQAVLRDLMSEPSSATRSSSAADVLAQVKVTSKSIRMANIIVATIPILLVYPFLQKHFAKGVMIGSIKG